MLYLPNFYDHLSNYRGILGKIKFYFEKYILDNKKYN